MQSLWPVEWNKRDSMNRRNSVESTNLVVCKSCEMVLAPLLSCANSRECAYKERPLRIVHIKGFAKKMGKFRAYGG